jgi:Sulfotransferase family
MAMSAERPISEGSKPSWTAPKSHNRVPDFFIVGHAKCGTTALYEMLRRHPQIHMPAKEPRFFAMKDIDMHRRETSSVQTAPLVQNSATRPRTLDGYLALFAGAGSQQRIGEATPAYLRSALAPARIAAVRPDARIIAILREPTSFLRSFHLQSVRGYNETQKDFQKAIALVEPRREGRFVPRLSRTPWDLLYTDHVRYVEQLRRYHAEFAPEQILVLIYEDFRRENEAVVRTVLRFLDVDDTLPIHTVETRRSRDVRYQQLHKLVNLRRIALRDLPVAGALSRTLNTLTPGPLRGTVRSNWRRVGFGEALPPDEQFMLDLRRRFKPEVQALSDYLGRDLVSLWGYEHIN